MYFLHYYIQRGFSLEYLLGLGVEKRCFYIASMLEALEERKKDMEGWGEVTCAL